VQGSVGEGFLPTTVIVRSSGVCRGHGALMKKGIPTRRDSLVFAQESSSRLKAQEHLGWRGEEPNGVIEGGCTIVAPLVVRKVEGSARCDVCTIWGRGYEPLRVIRSSEGNEARSESKNG
jgi:hypothetical protein